MYMTFIYRYMTCTQPKNKHASIVLIMMNIGALNVQCK